MAVTRAPTRQWTAQQLRNATPFGQGPRFLIRDRDDKFGPVFDRVAQGAGTRVVRTAVQAPLMNSVCERFLGSVRRECLDHLIILSEQAPAPRPRRIRAELLQPRSAPPGDRPTDSGSRVNASEPRSAGPVTALPVLGGLHHDYRAAA